MTRRLRRRVTFPILIAAVAVVSGCNIGISGADDTASSQNSNNSNASSAKYSISGTITGLTQSGLTLSSMGDTAVVAAGATSFKLPTPVLSGTNYSVKAQSQPLGQTCTIVNGSGMAQANVTNVSVKCTVNNYSIGGLITGLNGAGLVLTNGADTLTVTAGSSAFVFATKLPMGASYSVAVQTQPNGLQCQLTNASGTMPAAAVTNIMVVCGQWTWVGGSDLINGAATYGALGMPAAGN